MARKNLGVAPSTNPDTIRKVDLDAGLAGKQATGNYVTALTGDVTASGPGSVAATIANDAVTNAKLTNMNQATFKMRAAGTGTGDPIDGTVAQAKTALAYTAGDVAFTPTGDISATNVQAAVAELLSEAFPLGWGAFTSWVPTWTQSATINKTVSHARYTRVGRIIFASVRMVATSSGTASNAVSVSLPVATVASLAGVNIGTAHFSDSGVGFYAGNAFVSSTTTIQFLVGGLNTGAMGGAGGGFTAAVASGDVLTFNVVYEAAS